MSAARQLTLSVLAAAALVLLLAVGIAAATEASPSAAPAGPRLAVAKINWKPQRTTLISVDANGRRQARLAGGEPEGPIYTLTTLSPLSWRPDGSEVAFDGVGTIVVAKADGSGTHELNLAGAESPIYAPDNETLAFTRTEGRKAAAAWTVNLATGAQRRITPLRNGLEYVAASFSPDSSTLLATIVNHRKGRVEPVALDLGTGTERRLLAEGREPVYSPDGTKIALFRAAGPNDYDDLFVLDVGSGKLRRLTNTPDNDELFVSWDPSGQRLAFDRYRGDHYEWANSIIEINADGSCETEVLAKRRTVYYGASWQPGPGRGAGRIDC